ncbi:MAG TPA: hypothetical protein VGM39_07385 [Kofleriaceae bacterium]|jgi:hypothetical protein
MTKLFLACVLAAATAGCTATVIPGPGPAGPTESGYVFLGEREVNGGGDHDAIHVGRADGRFHAIRLKAEGSSLELHDVLVTFGDGDKFSPPTRLVFREGEWSRDIDLPGGARVIKRVEFRYGNLPGGGRAHLALFGR